MKELEENFEDRKGSNFEQLKGSNTEKIVNRKEQQQRKRLGVKPSDTEIDVTGLVARDVLGKVLSEEKPRQETSGAVTEIDDEEEKSAEDKLFDPNEEKRIKLQQLLNPRIAKTKELKNYMSRDNIREDIYKALNEIATNKLELCKIAIAKNIPTGLDEASEPKVVEFTGFGGSKGWKASNPYTKKTKYFGGEFKEKAIEFANKGKPVEKTAQDIVASHQALHNQTVSEEVEGLDEATRNPNVMRQGRTKVVKARVRGGKVQRRKRVSAVKGYTMRGGKLKRMSAAERMRRKRSQKRAAVKRRAKQARALMKRKRSMRRRASLGLKE